MYKPLARYDTSYCIQVQRGDIVPIFDPSCDDVERRGGTDDQTIAMLIAGSGNIPPLSWQHNPALTDKYGWSVALILAYRGIIPPKQWLHDTDLCEISYRRTVALQLACHGIEPPEMWEHDACRSNDFGNTVAMVLASNYLPIPIQWWHDPAMQNAEGSTVAMLLTANWGNVIPEIWRHDKRLRDVMGKSVEDIRQEKGLPFDASWHVDVEYEYCCNGDDNMCMICYDACEKRVRSVCGHVICVKCYMKWKLNICPYCKVKPFIKQ